MASLNDLLSSRMFDIRCRLCGWQGARPLGWVSAQRDMCCPDCASIIVLNTSDVKREIGQLRRQVAALHDLFVGMIPAAPDTTDRTQKPFRPKADSNSGELALLQACKYRGVHR